MNPMGMWIWPVTHLISHSFFSAASQWVETGHCGLHTEEMSGAVIGEGHLNTQYTDLWGRLIKERKVMRHKKKKHLHKKRPHPNLHPPPDTHLSSTQLFTRLWGAAEREEGEASRSLTVRTKDRAKETETLIKGRESSDTP